MTDKNSNKSSLEEWKFHIKYMLPTFSYLNETYIDLGIFKTIIEMQY